jgi:TolA-binding protein
MTTTSFKASGAFETIRPLSIPMTPMKLLLSACNLQGAADLLPAGLPLKTIQILDDHDNFKVAELTQLLQAVTDGHLPSEITQSIATIGQNLNRLPDSFKQYLNVEIPPSFAFEVSVTPEGTVQFNASTEPEHPIRLLFPGLLLGMPVLNGITLRSISFGALAGGSLFLLNVDADVDQFDIVTLGAALLLPIVPNHSLPSPKNIQRRLVLNNLMMIIVYQTVIPIPVPIFYDQIGIEYSGLEGIQFQTHAQFPMPSFDLREAGRLLSQFKQFFTDRTYLLDPNAAPEHLDLKFSLKHNYMELPSYMGGTVLGDREGGPTVSAYESLAQLLNGMKTLSLNELIKAVPVDSRINHTDVSFGPLSGSLGWMVTTPDEFKTIATQPMLQQVAYQRLGLADETQAAQLMTVLPPSSSSEQGLVVFLKGNVAVTNLATFETSFGLAASPSMGFNTGFQLLGKISDGMAIELAGNVSTPSQAHPSFQLNGRSKLTLLNQPIFQGDVQISDRRFQCQGMLDLYGLGGSVAMTIDRDQGADLRGELNAIDLGIFKLSGINNNPKPTVLIQIHPSQSPVLDLSGAVQLLGLRSETHIRVSDSAFLFTTTGNLFNRFSATLQVSGKRLTNSTDFHVAATMQTDFTQFLKAETTKVLKQAADDAQRKIGTMQQQVNDAQTEVNRLQGVVNTQRSIVRQERVNANSRLADARQTVANEQANVTSLQTTIGQKEGDRDRLSKEQKCTTIRMPNVPDFWNTHSVTTCVPNPASIAQAAKVQAEITGLQTRLSTEQGLLVGAQKALALLQQTIGVVSMDPVSIDADARVWGPLGALKVATESLTGYRAALDLARKAVVAGAAAGDYIAAHGLDALLVVNAASFVADLNTATSGQVILSVSLNYRGTATNLSLNFNFNDPVSSARQLGQRLLQI